MFCLLRQGIALSAAFCSMWKETKEKLMEKIKSPTIQSEEANESLWFLFQMKLYEEKNPNDFVHRKNGEKVGKVLHQGVHVLGQLARSHTSPCEI